MSVFYKPFLCIILLVESYFHTCKNVQLSNFNKVVASDIIHVYVISIVKLKPQGPWFIKLRKEKKSSFLV